MTRLALLGCTVMLAGCSATMSDMPQREGRVAKPWPTLTDCVAADLVRQGIPPHTIAVQKNEADRRGLVSTGGEAGGAMIVEIRDDGDGGSLVSARGANTLPGVERWADRAWRSVDACS